MGQDNFYMRKSSVRAAMTWEKYTETAEAGQSWVQLFELNLKSLKDIRLKSHHGKRRSKHMACQAKEATLPFQKAQKYY